MLAGMFSVCNGTRIIRTQKGQTIVSVLSETSRTHACIIGIKTKADFLKRTLFNFLTVTLTKSVHPKENSRSLIIVSD